MDKIYANARTVFVWLGQSDENFGVAIRSMDAIYDCCCKLAKLKGIHKSAYNAELRKSDPTPIYLPGGNDFAAANTLLPSTCSYEDLDLFFGHPWFRRVWVIQEVARCQNVQMMSDRFQYSWDLVALATYWLSLVYIDKKNLYSDFQNIEGIVNTIFMRSKSSKSSERTNFVGFLDRVRSFDATDPRDKVYGVLSWLNDFPPKLSSMFLPALYPDYTKSTLAVYTLVAIRSIELSQDLDILSHGFHGSSLEEDINIPSWVPQWNRGRRASFLLYYGLALDASRGKKYGINSQLQAQLSNDERSLKLNGVQCGVANRVTNHVPRLESLHGEITGESVLKNPLLGLLEALTSDLEAGRINSALICSANAPYDQRINPDYVRRLILGVELGLPSRIQGSFPMATSGADFASYIVAHIELLPEDNILKRSLDSGLLQDIADADGNAARFAKSGCYTWRRFFTTRTGYIGFGPACMREDDIICILRGGRVPYVLREKDNHWLFLGECYVHGIMLGEAVHLNEAGSWVGEEAFELR
ncbi:hypothetical protein B0O99DRAFT_632560 [Bisporella sp. PMI_857]|nr:hypothetical protein B0O99DRAFT_632560 [Bisporella sp. PMI_857]